MSEIKINQPRIFSVRVWTPGGPFEGTGFVFKAVYGTSIMAAEVLSRAVATGQLSRFTFGATSKTAFRKLDRSKLARFDEAFAAVGSQLGIEWAA